MFCERTAHHLERGHIDLKCLVFWSRKGYHLQSMEFALFQKHLYAAGEAWKDRQKNVQLILFKGTF